MMPAEARSFVMIHAGLAVLATLAALVSAGAALARPTWLARIGAITAALIAAAFVTGMRLDAPYRSYARQRLFVASANLGWLFERKMHASFFALALAAVALVTALATPRLDPEAAVHARRAARISALAAMVCATFATIASFIVGPHVVFH
jgi:hypothetical protein